MGDRRILLGSRNPSCTKNKNQFSASHRRDKILFCHVFDILCLLRSRKVLWSQHLEFLHKKSTWYVIISRVGATSQFVPPWARATVTQNQSLTLAMILIHSLCRLSYGWIGQWVCARALVTSVIWIIRVYLWVCVHPGAWCFDCATLPTVVDPLQSVKGAKQ